MSGSGNERVRRAQSTTRTSTGTARTVERTAEVLRLLSTGGQRVSDLAAATQLPRSAVAALLNALVGAGLVEHDPASETYGLGAALVHLGSSYLRANELRACAAKWARLLARETDHTVQVGTLHGPDVLIVNHVSQTEDSAFSYELGRLLPARGTAIGKVLLAYDHGGLVAGNDQDPNEHDQDARVLAELALVRQGGWAAASDGDALSTSVACPIFHRSGRVCGAIGIIGSPDQVMLDTGPRPELLERVRAAAGSVSRALGASAW